MAAEFPYKHFTGDLARSLLVIHADHSKWTPLPYRPVNLFELGLQFPLQSHCDYPEDFPGLPLPCSLSHFILICLLQPSASPTCRPLYRHVCKCPSQCRHLYHPAEVTSNEGTGTVSGNFQRSLAFQDCSSGWAPQAQGSTDYSEGVSRKVTRNIILLAASFDPLVKGL